LRARWVIVRVAYLARFWESLDDGRDWLSCADFVILLCIACTLSIPVLYVVGASVLILGDVCYSATSTSRVVSRSCA